MKKTLLKPISKKGIENRKKLNEVYAKIDSDPDNRFCKGCGSSNMLSHSHLIPRSQRKDLESDIRNITFHCLQRQVADKFGVEGCHSRWESMDGEKMQTLNDLWDNLEYIKEVDQEYYYKIITDHIYD